MVALPKTRLDIDDFLAWSLGQDDTRYELVGGEIVAMAPESNRHVDAKYAAWLALRSAIAKSGIDCAVVGDGIGVTVADDTLRQPDFSVQCGEREPDDRLLSCPIIVGEVLSTSSTRSDTGAKVADYFRVASVRHYLIVDPFSRVVIWHRRGSADGRIETAIVREGEIVLDPPGMIVGFSTLFGGIE